MNNWICAGLCAAIVGMSVWVWNVAETTAELRNDVVSLRMTVQARDYEIDAVTTASDLRDRIRAQSREILRDVDKVLSENQDFSSLPVPDGVLDSLRESVGGDGGVGAASNAAR